MRGGKRLTNYIKSHLNNLKSYSLSDGDIQKILPHDTNIITYPELQNYNNLNDVLDSKGRAIILFLTDSNNNGHWISIIKHPNHIEIFDSYGTHPNDWAKFLGGEKSQSPAQDISILKNLLKTANKPVINNNKAYQSKKYDVATCGRHATLRCIFHHMDIGQYDKFITGFKPLSPDDLVTIITKEYISK